MRLKTYLYALLCLFLFCGITMAQEVSLPLGNTITLDLETGNEISQWIEQARLIDSSYMREECSCCQSSPKQRTHKPIGKWILSAYLGKGEQNRSVITYPYTSFSDPPRVDLMGLSVLYRISDNLDIGLAYELEETEHMNSVYEQWNGGGYHYYSIQNKDSVKKILISGRWRPMISSFYIPFGIGLSYLEQKIESYSNNTTEESDGLSYYLGLGWNLQITQRLSLSLEGRYQRTNFDNFNPSSLRALALINFKM